MKKLMLSMAAILVAVCSFAAELNIYASGLKAGDVVVATGVHHLQDGQQVKPLPALTSSNVGGLL